MFTEQDRIDFLKFMHFEKKRLMKSKRASKQFLKELDNFTKYNILPKRKSKRKLK
jgi:hypothetical protein